MQRAIIWHKWQDPFMPLVDGEVIKGFEPEEDEEDPQFHKARQSFCDCGDGDCPVNNGGSEGKSKSIGPCVYGPRGVIPLHESNLPSKLFNFWMGHANFDLTQEVCDAICAVPGVETLDIFTRYRFRLAIGRAFNQDLVRKAIEQATCQEVEEPTDACPAQVEDPLASVKAGLAKTYPYWAIVVLSNKVHQYLGGQTADEVLEKMKRYEGNTTNVILSWENSKA